MIIQDTQAKKLEPIKNRDPANFETDKSAVRAIAQAAINVELFTIPLYLVALYSIQGTREIGFKGHSYFKGRRWPGMATTTNPNTPNEKAFNIVFSIFIEEMLHLQMAANIATAIGVEPCFNSDLLQNDNHGWTCYGDDKTVIPHVIDLKDTEKYSDVKVKLDSLNSSQIELFLAIEESLKIARDNVEKGDYFPKVPFKDWDVTKTQRDLPMFGSIGLLYNCYLAYLNIKYSDGEDLWEKICLEEYQNCKSATVQKDMFNYVAGDHPGAEYPCLATKLTMKFSTAKDGKLDKKEIDFLHDEVIDMMNAIIDQGEGGSADESNASNGQKTELSQWKRIAPPRQGLELEAVKSSATSKSKCPAHVKVKYQPYIESLKLDYPAYDDKGEPIKGLSRNAFARHDNSGASHYERFETVKELLKEEDFCTWDTWHKTKHSWEKDQHLLTTEEYDPNKAPKNIPTPEEMAGALNRLKENDAEGKNYKLVSQAGLGALKGITTVLDDYWKDPQQNFPYPAMVGSGNRISACWAIFGKAPFQAYRRTWFRSRLVRDYQ